MPALARLERLGRIERYPTQVDRRAGGALAAERHYLQFPGSASIGFIDGGATGYTTAYALVVKMAAAVPTSAGWPQYAQLVNASLVDYRYRTDSLRIRDGSPLQHYFRGVKDADGTDNYVVASGGLGVCAGAQVHCIGRNLGTNAVAARVIRSSDQAVFYSADTTAAEDSSPDTIAVGGTIKGDNTISGDAAYAAIQLIAAVFLDAVPSDALLQAYAAPSCHDARLIFGSSIKGYWAASSAVGSSVPALVGTVPMALTGVTAAALVSL